VPLAPVVAHERIAQDPEQPRLEVGAGRELRGGLDSAAVRLLDQILGIVVVLRAAPVLGLALEDLRHVLVGHPCGVHTLDPCHVDDLLIAPRRRASHLDGPAALLDGDGVERCRRVEPWRWRVGTLA
jgi:hypothetical protein